MVKVSRLETDLRHSLFSLPGTLLSEPHWTLLTTHNMESEVENIYYYACLVNPEHQMALLSWHTRNYGVSELEDFRIWKS